MKTYIARAVRSGDWWAIEVPELAGVFSQARRLDQVETMARDAIALTLDVAPDSFDVTVEPVLPTALQQVVDAVRASREEAELAATIATLRAKMAVLLLHDEEHLPLRDIGRVLGVSHQRAHQLLDHSEDLKDRWSILMSRLGEEERIPLEKVKAELGL